MSTHRHHAAWVALVAVPALVLGSLGSAVAGPALTTNAVRKIAATVVTKQATRLSVAHADTAGTATAAGNATRLAGQAATTYLKQSYTATLNGVTGVSSFSRLLPSIPAGTYLVKMHVTMALPAAANVICGVVQSGASQDLVDGYSARFAGFRTIDTQRVATVGTGALFAACTATAAFTMPAAAVYGPPQVSFTRIDDPISLGAVKGDGSGAAENAAAPTLR